MIDDSLIAPYERLAASRAEMAAAEGVSVRTLRRRLAAQRERAADAAGGAEDFPWVELVHGWHPAGPYYDLATDELEKPPGPFVVASGPGRFADRPGLRRNKRAKPGKPGTSGLRVQHAGDGKPVEQPQKSKAKFKPKQPSKRKRA